MAAVDSTLIIQNKGGGHGEIGYHLAKELASRGHKVTLLQDASATDPTEMETIYKNMGGRRKNSKGSGRSLTKPSKN